MADFTALRAAIQALTNDAETMTLIRDEILNRQDIRQHFTFVPYAHLGWLRPTFTMASGQKPYSSTYTGVDSLIASAKTMDLFKAKIEQEFEHDSYMDQWKIFTAANKMDYQDTTALAKFFVDAMIEKESYVLRNLSLWKAVRNDAGTTALDTFNGFEKIITDAITAGEIPSTQVLEVNFDESNTYDKIKELVGKVASKYRKQKDFMVLCSYEVLGWYMAGHSLAHNGIEPRMIMGPRFSNGANTGLAVDTVGDAETVIGCYLDGAYSGIQLLEEDFLTEDENNPIVIATCKSNLQTGSNLEKENAFKFYVKGDHYVTQLSTVFQFGCGIYEKGNGAIAVAIPD